jgi:predicted DNA-binding transcriptional regulator AlpA
MQSLLLLPFFLSLAVSGCMSLSNDRPPGPWHDAYQPIEDPESDIFLAEVLDLARADFGDPVIPINKILLRRSRKTHEARHYRIGEDFSLTECVDPTNGLFVVYIGVDPGHSNYYALLAHECVHLLNPLVTDWYMEGIATVFSEQACAEMEEPWGDWKRYFLKSRRDPYALSYRMMTELYDAFPAQYPLLVKCTAPNGNGSDRWQRIDIDQWVGSLPAERHKEALDIIEPYTDVLRKHTGKLYDFTVPSGL